MGWGSAAAVLAVVRPALVTLEERTAEELWEELLLERTALPELEELRVALPELLLEERTALPEELLLRVALPLLELLERTALPELLELLLEERVALELLELLLRVALPVELEERVALEVLVPELLRVSWVEVELLLEGLLVELLRLELETELDEDERVELPELLLEERVELCEELLERVAVPLLVLVCAAIWGAVSKAIAIKNEAA